MNKQNSWQRGYSLFFVAVFFATLLMQLFAPGIALKSISDKYLWKRDLIKGYYNFKYKVGDRVYSRAIIGKEGWLFYTGDMSIQDYQKTLTVNVGNLKKIVNALVQIKKRVDLYGGTFLLVIPPDKSTIYSDYMPDEIPVIGQSSNTDRFVELVQKDGNIQVLDLRPVLERARNSSQVYYKTDSHWNCEGAFYAYQEIIAELAAFRQDLQPHSFTDFQIISSDDSLLDVPASMGLDLKEDAMDAVPKFNSQLSVLPGLEGVDVGKSLRVVVNPKKDSPSLLILHDSFYDACLDSFIEPTFSRTISLHYGDAKLADQLDLVDKEKPDIVIFEFVERQMDWIARLLSK